jgi:hypothetical protein
MIHDAREVLSFTGKKHRLMEREKDSSRILHQIICILDDDDCEAVHIISLSLSLS